MKELTFALIGNPNCGKTTLFNQLTGSNQHVGNFPGVTVDKKEGRVRSHPDVVVVDLPGIYSLSPYTAEEVVSRDFLLHGNPAGVINIVDATTLERNLYLTLQLVELRIPTVLALNMMDEVRANGGYIDVAAMEAELGIPVVPISASKNEGVEELCSRAIRAAREKALPRRVDFCTGEVHRAIHSITHLVEQKAELAAIPARFAASKLAEGDSLMADSLHLTESERHLLEHLLSEMEAAHGMDREAAMADMRYTYIEKLCAQTVVRPGDTKEQLRSVEIDKVLTSKFWAIPIFFGIMVTIFFLTFGLIGPFLNSIMEEALDLVALGLSGALVRWGVNPTLRSLVLDGAFAGVASVLSFLPTIVTLFFFLSLLEDSGYMARVAFVTDRLLRRIGLSGRSFVPLLIGFGCSVPAIMATRTLASERDRKMTIRLTPFMSCSAKLPIYSVFTLAFFPKHRALVMCCLYFGGMLVGILYGLLLKNTAFKGNPIPFVMELPAYRLPSPKSVLLHMWEKAKDFLVKAFTIIFVASLVVWCLQSFDFGFNPVDDSSRSMLASVSRLIAPIFIPLGFSDWRAATALVTGLSAKEAVVSTLSVLLGAGDAELPTLLAGFFTPLQAVSFLTFTLLYMPCVAAMAAVKREMGGWKAAVSLMAQQTGVAWLVALFVYQGGRLLGLG
ncbi:MAG: ferrous iron transport protein B [Clostridia bacterium]|nr:ferrous iron transport protein B [Clostridia bacterium]